MSDIWAEEIVRKRTFSKDFKNADVNNNPLLAKNYRPVSVLPTVFKYLKN